LKLRPYQSLAPGVKLYPFGWQTQHALWLESRRHGGAIGMSAVAKARGKRLRHATDASIEWRRRVQRSVLPVSRALVLLARSGSP